jgi:hypothetical protein
MSPHKQHRNNQSFDTSNEEWSEILSVDVEEHPLSPSTVAASLTTVPTASADPSPVEVDVNKALSAQDLRSLKKQDPFLYYSLPGVREASVQQKRVDMHQIAQEGLRRTCASCPASIQTVATSDTTAKVKRCTRVSFECAPDLLLEDLWDEEMTECDKSLALAESRLEEFLSDMGLTL